MRWFDKNIAVGVRVENISDRCTGFQIAGPNATALLQKVTRDDPETMRFLDVRPMVVGMVECLVQRVSYTGDLGYEIYCDPTDQRALWHQLWAAGQPMGLRPFGMRAMMSLRLDKFFGSWMREFSPDYTAAETGLDRFISWGKEIEFIGKAAAVRERQNGSDRKLVVLEVDTDDADVVAYEPVWINGQVKGFCTSGGYSHYAQKSIAMALVPSECITDTLEAEIEILGKMYSAKRITAPFL